MSGFKENEAAAKQSVAKIETPLFLYFNTRDILSEAWIAPDSHRFSITQTGCLFNYILETTVRISVTYHGQFRSAVVSSGEKRKRRRRKKLRSRYTNWASCSPNRVSWRRLLNSLFENSWAQVNLKPMITCQDHRDANPYQSGFAISWYDPAGKREKMPK